MNGVCVEVVEPPAPLPQGEPVRDPELVAVGGLQVGAAAHVLDREAIAAFWNG